MLASGIDPSLSCTGLAAVNIETGEVLAWKAIVTKPEARFKATEDLARRLLQISAEVKAFCKAHPGFIVVEGQVSSGFGKGSSMASIGLLMSSYGAVLGSLPSKPTIIHSATVKSRLGITKKSTKDDTWKIAKTHFTKFPPELSTKAAREAVHDAVAIALSALPEMEQSMALRPINQD